MAAVHGKGVGLALATYDITRWCNQASQTDTPDTTETSNFQEPHGSKTYTTGQVGSTLTFQGRFSLDPVGPAPHTRTGIEAVMKNIMDAAVDAPFILGIQGLTIGLPVQVGGILTSKITTTATTTDVVSVQGDVMPDGAVRLGTMLTSQSTPQTASTTGATVDQGAATSTGGFAALIIDARQTLTGTAAVKVQHSTDGSTWTDLATFTTVAAATGASQIVQLPNTATINRYVRAVSTISGTGSANILVAIARSPLFS